MDKHDNDIFNPDRHKDNPMLNFTGTTDINNTIFGGRFLGLAKWYSLFKGCIVFWIKIGNVRLCPGAALAKQELGLVLCNILKIFDVLPPIGGEQVSKPQMDKTSIMRHPVPAKMKFIRRTGTLKLEDMIGLAAE